MTIRLRGIKVVDYRDVHEQPGIYSGYVTKSFEARPLPGKPEGITEEARLKPALHEIARWPILLAVLLSLLAGGVCLVESNIIRTSDANGMRVETEGVPAQGAVSLGEAIYTLSARR